MGDQRIGVVIITYQRREEALGAVERLTALGEQPPVVLVDNGSTDGTADAVRRRFPQVDVLALDWNSGAVGRNLGVRRLTTPYVAFCDDDTWWEPGSLTAPAPRWCGGTPSSRSAGSAPGCGWAVRRNYSPRIC